MSEEFKPWSINKGDKVFHTQISPQGNVSDPKPIPVEICSTYSGIFIRVKGYGDCSSADGYGCPIWIEFYEGKLMVRLWSDINSEDPTNSVSMEGALETARKEVAETHKTSPVKSARIEP